MFDEILMKQKKYGQNKKQIHYLLKCCSAVAVACLLSIWKDIWMMYYSCNGIEVVSREGENEKTYDELAFGDLGDCGSEFFFSVYEPRWLSLANLSTIASSSE